VLCKKVSGRESPDLPDYRPTFPLRRYRRLPLMKSILKPSLTPAAFISTRKTRGHSSYQRRASCSMVPAPDLLNSSHINIVSFEWGIVDDEDGGGDLACSLDKKRGRSRASSSFLKGQLRNFRDVISSSWKPFVKYFRYADVFFTGDSGTMEAQLRRARAE